MKNNAVKYLAVAILSVLVLSCKDYDAEFAEIQARIEKLQAADAQTRKMILSEMDRLSNEILDRIGLMEQNVYKHLDDAVVKLTDKILDASEKIHDKITAGSARLGTSIRDWENKINSLIDSKESDFNAARSKMESELKKAISSGDASLQRRIRNGMSQLDQIQNTFPEKMKQMAAKYSKIQDVADKYKPLSEKLAVLDGRKNDMKTMVAQYSDSMEEVLMQDITEFSSGQMQSLYENILDAYSTVESINDEISSMSDDIDSYYSSMPDVEGLLSDADNAFGQLEDLQSAISSFYPEDLETLISDISDALSAAENCDVDLSDVESSAQYYLGLISSLEQACDEAIAVIEERTGDMEDLDYAIDNYVGVR